MAAYSAYSDSDLSILLKSGDKEAFTEIYDRYWMTLYLHGRKMLRDDEEAKDIIQELFTQLWNRSSELELTVSLSSYLYKATRNKIFNHIAHKKVINDYQASMIRFMEEGVLITEELLREKELAILIEKEISMLPPKMREVFEMSRKQHLSYKEIGEILGISDHTVKRQVSNALMILRTKLGLSAGLIYILLSK